MKLAIDKLAFVVRTIFKFVKSTAVRLIIFELALIEVTVYKYNLTFWH